MSEIVLVQMQPVCAEVHGGGSVVILKHVRPSGQVQAAPRGRQVWRPQEGAGHGLMRLVCCAAAL